MKQFTKIVDTKIIYDTGEEEHTTRKTLHTIKDWYELTDEEKEQEIEKHQESLYEYFQECNYETYKCELDYLKEEFKEIEFDDIYLDSNSQGWWIDRLKNFKLHFEDIEIYGESLYLDYDMKIRRYIEYINLYGDSYYGLSQDKYDKIVNTKKYKDWIAKAQDVVNKWVDRVNEICGNLGDYEYYSPTLQDNREVIDCFFDFMEFEFVEESE